MIRNYNWRISGRVKTLDVLDTLRDDNGTHRGRTIHHFPELADTDLRRNSFHSSERVWDPTPPSNNSTLDKDR